MLRQGKMLLFFLFFFLWVVQKPTPLTVVEKKPAASIRSTSSLYNGRSNSSLYSSTWISQTCDPFHPLTHSAPERVD